MPTATQDYHMLARFASISFSRFLSRFFKTIYKVSVMYTLMLRGQSSLYHFPSSNAFCVVRRARSSRSVVTMVARAVKARLRYIQWMRSPA